MNLAPVCLLYTQDPDLARRIKAFLRVMAQVRHVAVGDRLDAVLQQAGPAVLLVDLRAKDGRDLLEQIPKQWPEALIIALGTPRSEPLREAEQDSSLYAAEDLQLDRRHFQALISRAFDHLRLMQENRDLREQTTALSLAEQPRHSLAAPDRLATTMPLLRFPRVFRRFENVEALLTTVVEGLADATGVSRVGIFSRIRQSERYRLRAGLRCLPETSEVEYEERDPLVRWFELHAHAICRGHLTQAEPSQRPLLRRALDTLGAEIIVPLHARGRIIGWLFFGHRLTGQRFDYQDLENLLLLAEHVSTVLENALLNEEITVQKTLAETLLKSIPPGIVAIDEDAIVRWFNPTAEQVLGLQATDVLSQPVEAAGLRLADYLREALATEGNLPARRWVDGKTQRSLAVEARRVMNEHTPFGAVAVVHDLTAEESLRHKQDLLDRATFWTDLAASMSHEIRNPLVAIKTFAQLLPERFDDPDFRKDFNHIVVQEIDRLDRIITQINNFAHPSELVMKSFDLRHSLKKALQMARERTDINGTPIETDFPADLPHVIGDENALTEAFAHLVANAAEAIGGRAKPRITLAAKSIGEGVEARGIIVTVQDNGRGIDPELKAKIFSPFCTTKARGMGLGLSIVKRTIFDHNGRLDIDSNPRGTSVSVVLPASTNGD